MKNVLLLLIQKKQQKFDVQLNFNFYSIKKISQKCVYVCLKDHNFDGNEFVKKTITIPQQKIHAISPTNCFFTSGGGCYIRTIERNEVERNCTFFTTLK